MWEGGGVKRVRRSLKPEGGGEVAFYSEIAFRTARLLLTRKKKIEPDHTLRE